MTASKPPYSPSGEGSQTAENVTYHRAAEAALVACAHPRCERPSDLNPPYCCLPCEVGMSPDALHLHSVTCDRKRAAAWQAEASE